MYLSSLSYSAMFSVHVYNNVTFKIDECVLFMEVSSILTCSKASNKEVLLYRS